MITQITKDPEPAGWREHHFGLPPARWAALDGKSFWITGAGTGFGRSLACSLAAAGCQVILTGRRREKLAESLAAMEKLGISAARCQIVTADLTDRRQVEQSAQLVMRLCPSLHGLINNAALPSRPGSVSPLQEDPPEYWDRMLATNLTAPWLLTRAVLPHLLASGCPRVLFISSGAGWAGTPGLGVYNLTKAALNSLGHCLAQELARDHTGLDIQVNVLAAGEARTEMNQGSDRSPFAIAGMALALLSHPAGGPNGCFFGMDGQHLAFGQTQPHPRSLLEASSQTQDPTQGKRLFIHQCLDYDDGPADLRCLQALERFMVGGGGNLAIYGAGRLTTYLLRHCPNLSSCVRCVIDDDPAKLGAGPGGVPVTPLDQTPAAVDTIFLASTRALSLARMGKRLLGLGRKLRLFTLSAIEVVDKAAIPAWAWREPIPGHCPADLPDIRFESDKDVILLEMPPRYMPMIPYGLGYVHNILKAADVDVQTMDLNIIFYHRYHARRILDGEVKGVWPVGEVGGGDPWQSSNTDQWSNPGALEKFRPDLEEVIAGLIAARPRILGMSLNGNNGLLAKEVIRRVKAALPETMVLVGGYDCVYRDLALTKVELYDYMFVGETELTLGPVVQTLLAGQRPRDLPGVISRFDSQQREWQPSPLPTDLDAIDFPRYEWTDLNLYRDCQGRISTPVAGSRGCHWGRCNFCAERFNWRRRRADKVVDEIQWHAQRSFDVFHFNESDVNGDPGHLLDICREIIKRGLKVKLYGQMRIDPRNDLEFFHTIKQAGFTILRFGVDGWTDHVLRLQRKGYSMRTVEQNLRDCNRAGLMAAVNMVIGVPGETEEDVEESIRNITRLRHLLDNISTINMLILANGSHYYLNPEQHNIRFRGDREQVFREHPTFIPDQLWYSEDPYIDHEVRWARYTRILRSLYDNGVPLGEYAKWEVVKEANRQDGLQVASFDQAVASAYADNGDPPPLQSAKLRHRHGLDLRNQGRRQEALAELSVASQLDPSNPRFLNSLAVAQWEMGQTEQAQGNLNRSLALDPRNTQTMLNLILIMEAMGRKDEALVLLENFLGQGADPRLEQELAHLRCVA